MPVVCAACINGVPAAGLPKTTSVVGRSESLTLAAPAAWSMRAKIVTPISSSVVMNRSSEWQRDWAREATIPAIAEITVAHGGASGVAFAWEQQLLNSGRK